MIYRSLAAAVAVVLVAPGGARPDDGWSQGSGYDVTVDLNASGAVSLDTFQAPLAPYGDWLDVGTHGRVWRPRVAVGWRPYYYGRWEWTNEGWFWASDEPWGWAAYHYGRWAHDPYYGWVWVPGHEWAPAWVSWRVSGDVIGWAPLAPGLSVYVAAYPFVDFWWTFVPTTRFVSVPVYRAAYAPSYSRRWYGRTAPAPARPAPRPDARAAPAPRSALAWGGPAPRVIEERIGRPVTPARVVPAAGPGQRGARPGEVSVYRPERRWAPPRETRGRGPGVAPAPGRGGREVAPRASGPGRGPGAAPAPGWSPPREDRGGGPRARDGGTGTEERGSPPETRGGGRGDDRPAPAPSGGRGRSDVRDDHGRSAAPAPRR